jgi:PAS domain-containing protein
MAAIVIPMLLGTAGSVWLTVALARGDERFIGDAPVAGAVVAMVAGFAAYHMIRIAWRRHADPAGEPCRSIGWHGVGTAMIALTGLAISVTWVFAMRACSVGDVVAIGLTLASAAFLLGLLLMPGAATSVVTRVRRALDGASVGMSIMFTFWVLVIAPKGRVDSTAFWTAIVTCCMLAIAVIVALRPAVDRRAAWLCTGGVCGGVLGLSGLGFSLQSHLLVGWPSVFGAVSIGSTGLMWLGAKRTPIVEEPPAAETPMLAIHPVLTAPAAVAVVVALHRLLTGGEFDRASIVLGVLTGAMVALRETLAARDVAQYARRVAGQEAQYRTLVAGSADVIMVLGSDLTVRWQSTASARLFALSDQEVVGRHFQSMVHPEDAVCVGAGWPMCGRVRRRRVRGCPGSGRGSIRDGFGRWRETETAQRISAQRRRSPGWCTFATLASARRWNAPCTGWRTPTRSPGWPTAARC